MQIIFHTPGQIATIFLETTNASGVRMDGYTTPSVVKILDPDLEQMDGYSDGYSFPLTHIETGLYVFTFEIPTGSAGIGSYLVDITHKQATTETTIQTLYHVIVTAPFGNFGISTG